MSERTLFTKDGDRITISMPVPTATRTWFTVEERGEPESAISLPIYPDVLDSLITMLTAARDQWKGI